MIQTFDFSYPSSDKIHTVHAREWVPEGRPRGVVQIVHGVAEHIGRYDSAARFLASRGYVVCGEDHLGHGLTAGGKFGYFGPKNGWDLVARDVRRLRQLEGEKLPNLPYVILGHSMGSFLTRTYLIRWPGTVDAAVLSGTGQEPAAAVASGKALSGGLCRLKGPDHVSRLVNELSLGSYNKAFKPNRTSSDWLSRDEAAVDAYLADPLCNFPFTAAGYRDLFMGLGEISSLSWARRVPKELPVFLVAGDQDPVGNYGQGPRQVGDWLVEAGVEDVRVKLYPGMRHEILNEIGKEEVYGDILQWLNRHMGMAE